MRVVGSVVTRLPLALGAALIVGACIVPSLDGEFKVDAGAEAVTTDGSSGSSGSSTSSSSSGGTSSSSSSSSSSSGTADGGKDTGAPDVDAGPPLAFCKRPEQAGAVFCLDFPDGENLPAGWDQTINGGSIEAEGAGDGRLLHATLKVNQQAALTRTLGKALTKNQTVSLRAKVKVDISSNVYANVLLVEVGGVERGLAVNPCDDDESIVCFVENDRFPGDPSAGKQQKIASSATVYDALVTVTWTGSDFKSSVSINGTSLNMRNSSALPGNSGNTNPVIRIGVANGGNEGNTTNVRVDDVVVTL